MIGSVWPQFLILTVASGVGDPAEDASVATIVFLLDAKLVLLSPVKRVDSPLSDLKYDMKVLSDKVEWCMVLTNQADQPALSILNDSIWAWDGSHVSVNLLSFHSSINFQIWLSASRNGPSGGPIKIGIDFYPLTILPEYGIITGLSSQIIANQSVELSMFKVKPMVFPSRSRWLTI
jgi:RAB6A-GEF complex partner protein 1